MGGTDWTSAVYWRWDSYYSVSHEQTICQNRGIVNPSGEVVTFYPYQCFVAEIQNAKSNVVIDSNSLCWLFIFYHGVLWYIVFLWFSLKFHVWFMSSPLQPNCRFFVWNTYTIIPPADLSLSVTHLVSMLADRNAKMFVLLAYFNHDHFLSLL